MESSEIIDFVGRHEPALMAKTAQMVALLGRIEPDFVEDTLKDFNTILGVVKEKTAAMPEVNWKPYMLAAGGTVVGGLASSIATDLYDAAKRGLSKGHNFKRIMEANPSLKKEVDQTNLRRAYNAVHRYAPEFTADPMVGGAILKRIATLPDYATTDILNLISSRKNLKDAKGNHFQELAKLGPLLTPAEGPDPQLEYRKARDTKMDADNAEQKKWERQEAANRAKQEQLKMGIQAKKTILESKLRLQTAKELEDYKAFHRNQGEAPPNK